MKLTVPVLRAYGAGVAAAAVVATVILVGGSGDEDSPESIEEPRVEKLDAPGERSSTPSVLDPTLWAPRARPVFPDFATATPDSAECSSAREQAERLMEGLQSEVSAIDREAARQVVQDAVRNGQTEADGYDLFGGGEMLKGNFVNALWAALEALNRDLQSRFVANAGVYLMDRDRLNEAEVFLRCAGDLDPRSPFVIEARAMLALRRDDCESAEVLIALAVDLMPGDMNVRYSAGFIHQACGDRGKAMYYLRAAERIMPNDPTVRQAIRIVDPSAAPRPPVTDTLDALVEECVAFLDETVAHSDLALELHREMQERLPEGFRDDSDIAETLRQNVQDNKDVIRIQLELAHGGSSGAPDPFAWNQALSSCVTAYAQAIYDYESVVMRLAPHLIFSAALGMDPLVYYGKWARNTGWNDLDYVLLDEDNAYYSAVAPAFGRRDQCYSAADDAAQRRACDRAFCGEAVPLFQAFKSVAEANMSAAEAGFVRAAEDYANFWLAYIAQGEDYADRAIEAILPEPQAPALASNVAQGMRQAADVYLGGTGELVAMTLTMTYEALQFALEYGPQEVGGAAAGPPNGEFALCPQDRPNDVLVDPPIDPFLAALQEATTVEVGPSFFDCETKVGAFSMQVKSSGGRDVQVKVSEKVGDVSYGTSVRRGGRVGGDVSYSQSVSSHGVAAKGTVKIWGESRPGGRVDYGAQLEGKLGTGITYNGGGVACYFVSGKATFNARVFADSLS